MTQKLGKIYNQIAELDRYINLMLRYEDDLGYERLEKNALKLMHYCEYYFLELVAAAAIDDKLMQFLKPYSCDYHQPVVQSAQLASINGSPLLPDGENFNCVCAYEILHEKRISSICTVSIGNKVMQILMSIDIDSPCNDVEFKILDVKYDS